MKTIFLACIITVAVETGFFWLFGYRDGFSLKIVALANVVTNLCLNLFLAFVPQMHPFPQILIPEAVVVAAECFIYFQAFGRAWRLFVLTLAVNVITYSLGLVLRL